MAKLFLHLIITAILVQADIAYAQGSRVDGEDIYKHYTGTIGSRHVSLDLRYGFQGASNYDGSTFYYDGEDEIHRFIIFQPSSFAHNVKLSAIERKPLNSFAEDWSHERDNVASWSFVISGDSLIGTWRSADGASKLDIRLAEGTEKSYPMDMFIFDQPINGNKTWFLSVQPASRVKKDDAAFISDAMLRFSGGDKLGVKDWVDFPQQCTIAPPGAVSMAASIQQGTQIVFLPVYNDNDFLVLQRSWLFETRIAYLCLDVRNKKVLDAADVLMADKQKLSILLERALRKKGAMTPDEKLNTRLKVDKIPVTENIAIANNGINFTYDAGEIHAMPITVFLPYKELSGMLTPAFKKRIGL